MANIKRIKIVGQLAFNAHEGNNDLQMLYRLLNTPTFGLRLKWDEMPSKQEQNEHGGITTFYRFTIAGEEAVSFQWFDWVMDTIRTAGGITEYGNIIDIEQKD